MRFDASKVVGQAGVMWQHKREFEAFLLWMHARGIKSVLEIGTGYGGSAYCFGETTDHGRVVTVDFDQAGAARVNPEKRRAQPNPNFVQITGDSRTDEIEAQVAAYGPFDLVFFDTEHPYETCVDNFERYGKMSQCYIAQHDINMDEQHWTGAGLPRFWREVLVPIGDANGCTERFIAPDADPRFPRWGGIGVILCV